MYRLLWDFLSLFQNDRPPNLCDWKIGIILLKNRKEIAFPIGVCTVKLSRKIGKSYRNMSWEWSKFRFFPPNSEWLGGLEWSKKKQLYFLQIKITDPISWKCDCMYVQLDLGYPAISYPDISIIRPWSCSILSIVYIVYFQLQSCSRQKQVVNICFILLSNPFYMSDNLLQIE